MDAVSCSSICKGSRHASDAYIMFGADQSSGRSYTHPLSAFGRPSHCIARCTDYAVLLKCDSIFVLDVEVLFIISTELYPFGASVPVIET